MNRSAIEAKVLQIIERVRKKQPLEDSLVELKREWHTNLVKTARQIAGHANAARGEPILWLIGLDEIEGVVGADQKELANWWPQVQKYFDEITPDLRYHLNVIDDDTGKPVVALLFDTDRCPFLVKDGNGQRSVPWREGTRCEPAKRSQLLKILVPSTRLPHVEVIRTAGRCISQSRLEFAVELYLTPTDHTRVFLPRHRMTATALIGSESVHGDLMDFMFHGQGGEMDGMKLRLPQIVLDSAGYAKLAFSFICTPLDDQETPLAIKYTLGIAGDENLAIIRKVEGTIEAPMFDRHLIAGELAEDDVKIARRVTLQDK